MAGFLKMTGLEERKRHLLVRSEVYRQVMTLEVANIKLATALLKRKLRFPAISTGLARALTLFAGIRMMRRRKAAAEGGGVTEKIARAIQILKLFQPFLVKRGASRQTAEPEQNGVETERGANTP